MAIYHLSMKPIKRSERSAIVAAAYRSCSKIVDKRTGQICDYSRKSGNTFSQIFVPKNCLKAFDRSDLWNAVEHKHKRSDAILSREVEVALPVELSELEQKLLIDEFAQYIADQYQVGVDANIHKPDRGGKNWHCHLMLTACVINADSSMGKKAELLDPIHCKRRKIQTAADHLREVWEVYANDRLDKYNVKIDRRTLIAQGIYDRLPQKKIGPAAMAIERKTGKKSDNRQRHERKNAQYERMRAADNSRIARQIKQLKNEINDIDQLLLENTPSQLPQGSSSEHKLRRLKLNHRKFNDVQLKSKNKKPKPP